VESLTLRSKEFLDTANIEVLLNRKAHKLDTGKSTVQLDMEIALSMINFLLEQERGKFNEALFSVELKFFLVVLEN